MHVKHLSSILCKRCFFRHPYAATLSNVFSSHVAVKATKHTPCACLSYPENHSAPRMHEGSAISIAQLTDEKVGTYDDRQRAKMKRNSFNASTFDAPARTPTNIQSHAPSTLLALCSNNKRSKRTRQVHTAMFETLHIPAAVVQNTNTRLVSNGLVQMKTWVSKFAHVNIFSISPKCIHATYFFCEASKNFQCSIPEVKTFENKYTVPHTFLHEAQTKTKLPRPAKMSIIYNVH